MSTTLTCLVERDAIRDTARMASRLGRTAQQTEAQAEVKDKLKPLDFNARSANELRPSTFDQMVGQERLKRLLRRIVDACKASGRPMDHMLLVGQSGTGKTTIAQIVAAELGRDVYMLKAPLEIGVFEELAEVAKDGDVVIVDEIHMVVSGDRRGLTQAADPETFYHVMEDHRLMTPRGMVDFPSLTFIGATTDAGLLPEAFLGRFPLKPQLDPYTEADMTKLAIRNAAELKVSIVPLAAQVFARACRMNPRQLNTYVRNATSLSIGAITQADAEEVVTDLNSCTLDGLTMSMQRMLKCLLMSERKSAGEVVYRASVNTIATVIGFSRDTKHVSLFVEPWLLTKGYVQVGSSGRELTPAGVKRAREL
jgi:Holliday junction DNA helicase RuvB